MSTFEVLQNLIADDVLPGSTAATSGIQTQIQKAIQAAVAHYERQRFWFNEKRTSFTLSSSQEWYTATEFPDLPYIVEFDRLTLANGSGSLWEIRPRTFEYVESRLNSTTGVYGDPTDYSYYRDQLRFYPIANAARVVTVSYVYKPATLSASSDTNIWTTHAEALIRNHAEWDLWWRIKREEDMAAQAKAAELMVLDEINKETGRKTATDTIRGNYL